MDNGEFLYFLWVFSGFSSIWTSLSEGLCLVSGGGDSDVPTVSVDFCRFSLAKMALFRSNGDEIAVDGADESNG